MKPEPLWLPKEEDFQYLAAIHYENDKPSYFSFDGRYYKIDSSPKLGTCISRGYFGVDNLGREYNILRCRKGGVDLPLVKWKTSGGKIIFRAFRRHNTLRESDIIIDEVESISREEWVKIIKNERIELI